MGAAGVVAAAAAVNGPWTGRTANCEETSDCESCEDVDPADNPSAIEQVAESCPEPSPCLASLVVNQEPQEELIAHNSDPEELAFLIGLSSLVVEDEKGDTVDMANLVAAP